MPDAHAGMMVTPSLRLVRPLGEGGMGAVWVAYHEALRTEVVVKFISSGLRTSREAVERFSREAAAASQVKSPHVVQTFDHGLSTDGTPYIVMELLEGRDLGAYLDAHGKLPPEQVLDILTQLSRALDRAHERGIVHRDIKPGNIFLCEGGADEIFVKLLDFGIAKGVDHPRIDSGTKTGSMIGSPFYMSPEQILGSKDLDQRSDLWSVGVVAFEALTGKKPFDAETMGGLAIRIHSAPLPLPSSLEPGLPRAVDAWFERACSRDVDGRFSSARELAQAFARALGGEVPSSKDAPRVSTGAGARPDSASGSGMSRPPSREESARTLVAGSSTSAGLSRSTPPRSTSRRLALLGVSSALLGVIAFVVVSSVRNGRDPRDDVPTASEMAPSRSAIAPSAEPPAAASLAGLVDEPAPVASSTTAAASASAAGSVAPPPEPAPPPSAAHAKRRPPSTHSTKPGSSTNVAAPPKAAESAPPKPVGTGHDIF